MPASELPPEACPFCVLDDPDVTVHSDALVQALVSHFDPRTALANHVSIRVATQADVPALNDLIATSVRQLSAGFYTPEQIEAALEGVFGVDSQLIADGTYFIIDGDAGPAASGGWSGRRTLYGGDQAKSTSDPRLDPRTEPARIRAFFVHPLHARRGLARQLYDECERAARAADFLHLELMATLPGEPLYLALGFTVEERVILTPAGVAVPFARMSRSIASVPSSPAR